VSAPAIGKRHACVIAAAALMSLDPMKAQSPVQSTPASVRALFDRGVAHYQKGDPHSAIGDFDEAIRLQSTFSRVYVLRGSCHMQKGDSGKPR
jgi:hypothetical protein